MVDLLNWNKENLQLLLLETNEPSVSNHYMMPWVAAIAKV